MLTAPMVDNTGRSVRKNANKFKGVVTKRTMDGMERLVHMKLCIHKGIRRQNQKTIAEKTASRRGITVAATHDLEEQE